MSENCVFIAFTTVFNWFHSYKRMSFSLSNRGIVLKMPLNLGCYLLNYTIRNAIGSIFSLNDFKLKVNQGKQPLLSGDKCSDLKDPLFLVTRNYLSKTEYKDVSVEDFKVPFSYCDEKVFLVIKDKIIKVNRASSLRKYLVNILYSYRLRKCYDSYSINITLLLVNVIEFVANKTHIALFKLGIVDILLNMKAIRIYSIFSLSNLEINLHTTGYKQLWSIVKMLRNTNSSCLYQSASI